MVPCMLDQFWSILLELIASSIIIMRDDALSTKFATMSYMLN